MRTKHVLMKPLDVRLRNLRDARGLGDAEECLYLEVTMSEF